MTATAIRLLTYFKSAESMGIIMSPRRTTRPNGKADIQLPTISSAEISFDTRRRL